MRKAFTYRHKIYFLSGFFLLIIFFIVSCKKSDKKQTEENQIQEEVAEDTYDFYNPSDDTASWVESLLVRVEEERIAQELAEMEASRSEYELNEDEALSENETESSEEPEAVDGEENESEEESEELNPIEKFFEEAGEGRVLSGKNDELRFYEFQNEIISPQIKEDGFVMIHSVDGNVIRSYYNKEYQLVKKEEWKIPSASNAKKEKTEEFIYSQENGKAVQKNIYTDDSEETVLYNKEALPLTSKKFALSNNKKYQLFERSWAYDENKRVIKDEKIEYTYKDSDFKNKSLLFSKKYEYEYNDELNENQNESETENNSESNSDKENDIPPDFKYYENNILKMQNKYTEEKGSYISWIYFDEKFSVKTYYEDDVRTKDEYYNDGKLFRTKIYEKMQDPESKDTEQKVVHQGE